MNSGEPLGDSPEFAALGAASRLCDDRRERRGAAGERLQAYDETYGTVEGQDDLSRGGA